jgi:CNT family concentrative nucleoside transporter
MERAISALGLVVFVAIAYVFSTNRKAIRWRPVVWGLALQLALGVVVLRTAAGYAVFKWIGDVTTTFLNFSDAGARFVFGEQFLTFYFAFKVLPTIIFFSSVITVLYHFGILQRIVEAVAWVMMRTMGTSGAETLSTAANIFVGQTEAPLLIKPYINAMTLSELHAVMTGGFATIAGSVMAAYIAFGAPAEHLIAASVMSAPAALVVAKLLLPETEESATAGTVKVEVERTTANAVEAASTGALDGMRLALNVAAMLIAFLAILALVNSILAWLGGYVGVPALSLELIFSYLFAPVAWLMGVPWQDCGGVGVLLGKRLAINEFIAYADLKPIIDARNALDAGLPVDSAGPILSRRAIIITTYALCGFANFGSIGIQIGGIGGIAPERRGDLARLGIRAMFAGLIACFLTACVAGMLL